MSNYENGSREARACIPGRRNTLVCQQNRTLRAVYSVLLHLLALTIFGSTIISATPKRGLGRESPDETQQRGIPKYPDVSATQILFLFNGELWLLPREGGVASPLTKESGPKSFPKFSPDGQTVAFTGSYDGIYAIPVRGGTTTRITHNPGGTDLCNWAPDGKLLFMTDTFFGPADFGNRRTCVSSTWFPRQVVCRINCRSHTARTVRLVPTASGLPTQPMPRGGTNIRCITREV